MSKVIFFIGNWLAAFIVIGFVLLLKINWDSSFLILYAFLYIYFFPILLYRILYLIFKKEYGRFEVFSKQHLLWWYGIQLQNLYSRFTFLEEFLRFFPFVYTFWLRLWGAKLGKYIFWSPNVLIVDRGDLIVGDLCIFGFGSKVTSHLLSKSHKRNSFIYAPIKIGNEVIIGAETNIGPGVEIGDKLSIAALSTLLPFSSWSQTKEYSQKEK